MSFVSNNTFGTLSSAPHGAIVNQIFKQVSSVLKDFHADVDENENAITNRFCIALNKNKQPECPYFFHHQNLESDAENTSVDFAAFGTLSYSGDAGVLVKFEAKRLTALPKKREREYVIGQYELEKPVRNTGGIERFKNGRHGRDVTVAGMIGYVQTESFDVWFNRINGWIHDEINTPHDTALVWNEQDMLNLESLEGRIAFYNSNARRVGGDSIHLKHIWIDFT